MNYKQLVRRERRWRFYSWCFVAGCFVAAGYVLVSRNLVPTAWIEFFAPRVQ
jgi:hypothetical protein